MARHVVSVLDVYAPAVRAAIKSSAPSDFDVRFADSYEDRAQRQLAKDATFLLAGWATVPAELIKAAPQLRMVHKWGIGVDRIDVEALRTAGIPLAITAGVNAGPVAEHTIMLMLAVYRRLSQIDRALRQGKWLKAEMREVCLQLSGKTVGLVGFGAIGRTVALKLRGFETRILYFDTRRPDATVEKAFGVEYQPLDELLVSSDVVSLHAPLTGETRGLIGRDRLERMKRTAILVNAARGELVDEQALYEALRSGKIYGAGLDAFAEEPPSPDNPLLKLDQVVVTPHSGGAAFDNVENTAKHAFGNMLRFLRGEALPPADVVVPVQQ